MAVALILLTAAGAAAQGLTGKWDAKNFDGQRFSLVLRRDGSKLSGTCDGRELSGSVVEDRRFHFKVAPYKDAQGRTISKYYDGYFGHDFITGALVIHTASDQAVYQWSAERVR